MGRKKTDPAGAPAGGEVVATGVGLPALKQVGKQVGKRVEADAKLRYRQDGLTPRRQEQFVEALARTGCVKDACRAARISDTSIYRARKRVPEFDRRCAAALATARPSLEETAYQRAVTGWEEPIFQGGKQVGAKRRYSDTILRTLITRGDKTPDPDVVQHPIPTDDEVGEILWERIDALARHLKKQARRKAVAWCDDMEKRGLAP